MSLITNVRDKGALHHVVREHIDKYFESDIDERPLVLVITRSGIAQSTFSAQDLDECSFVCPFHDEIFEAAHECAHEEVYDELSEEYEHNMNNALEKQQEKFDEVLEKVQEDSYKEGFNEGYSKCLQDEKDEGSYGN